jgi:hypothetical protein
LFLIDLSLHFKWSFLVFFFSYGLLFLSSSLFYFIIAHSFSPSLPLFFHYTVGDSYIASGGIDGEVKLWTVNGENVGSWSHKSIVSSLKVFKDDLGGWSGG